MSLRLPAPLLFALPFLLVAEESAVSLNYGFGEPEIVKLDWSTRALTPTDLDNDGLRDLVLINNDTARIELLYQLPEGEAAGREKKTVNRNRWDPVLEDARFESEAITVGFPMFDLGVGDLNMDGLVDLAYTSREVPLTVRFQGADGDWIEVSELDGFEALGWTNTVKVVDLDSDDADELVVVSADAIRIFRQSDGGGLGEPDVLYVTGENPFNLMVEDATGDGLLDLLYLSTDGKQVLATREQLKAGGFGPESRHVMERPARVIRPMPDSSEDSGALAVVDSRSGTLEFIEMKSSEKERDGPSILQGAPEIYPIFRKVRESASYALGDINGSGEPDLVVANPAEAELLLFSKENGRFKASKAFPSFSEISSLTSGRFFKGREDSLIVISEEEKTLGLTRYDKSGRLSFPRQLKVGEGNPVCSQAIDLEGDGYDELVLINESDGSYFLVVAAPAHRKSQDGGWEVVSEMKIEGVRRKPEEIAVVDIFGEDQPGLMLFIPREAPVLLAPQAEGGSGFVPVATDSSIRESLLKGVLPAQISVFDVNSDGANELVVAREGFARAFTMTDREIEMVDQFNARRGKDTISAVIPVETKAGVTGMVFYVKAEGEMQYLQRDEDGVFRYKKAVDVGQIDLIDWMPLAGDSRKQGQSYVFAGEDRFWFFGGQREIRSWEVLQTYETDLDDIHYSHVAGGDFDGDGSLELVSVDGSDHVVDFLSYGDGDWSSQMFWQVFEQNMHYQGRTGANLEPRQIVIDDLTNDGKLDFAFLVHDRILIYPQE